MAKAVQKGKPFDYAMNCSILLALCFLDKDEPKIAASGTSALSKFLASIRRRFLRCVMTLP